MDSKSFVAVAVLLAFLGQAPVADASSTDDLLSRTFPYLSAVRVESRQGIGWYDAAAPPNVCLVDARVAELPLLGLAYYENARIHTNLPGVVSAKTSGVPPAPLPCPAAVNPLCTISCAVRIATATVAPFARTLARQDGLACTQHSTFITCIPTAAAWWVALCTNGPAFIPRAAGANKGLLGGTGLEALALSADIDCTSYGTPTNYSGRLGGDSQLTRSCATLAGSFCPLKHSILSSGDDGFDVAAKVRFGNGFAPTDETGYLVSCLSATWTEIDTSTSVPTIRPGVTGDAVDWFLALDLDDWLALVNPPVNGWAVALEWHLGASTGGRPLQGLYDLGGGNGCDFTLASAVAPRSCENRLDDDGDGAVDFEDSDCRGAPFGIPETYIPWANWASGG